MHHRLVRCLAATSLFVAAVLLLDAPGAARQLSLGVATTLFLLLVVRAFGLEARPVIVAIIVATAGEVLLSVVWGLYEYRDALLPLYVPPGHGLFYALAAACANNRWLVARERAITIIVLITGSAVAGSSLWSAGDVWGTIWWLAAASLLAVSDHKLLLAACFVNATLLEWAGTFLGNWRWQPVVPGLGLTSANPPSGVGLLYVLLDLLVVAIVAQLARRAERTSRAFASSEAT